jgi:DNA-binding SARP family transcriptional activator
VTSCPGAPFRTIRVPGGYRSSVAPLAIHYIGVALPKRGRHAVTVSFPSGRGGGEATLVYQLESETAGYPSTLVRIEPERSNRGRKLTFTVPVRLQRAELLTPPMLVLSTATRTAPRLTASGRDEPAFASSREAAALGAAALTVIGHPDFVAHRLERRRRADPLDRRSGAHLAIRALGGFQVCRGGVAVRPCEWQSRKARDLLKLLVARRFRPAPRECLIEALWPGQDPSRTRSRLSVALSTVRGVLDPAHGFDPGHYVSATRETIALKTESVALDLEAFLARAEAGLALVREGRVEEAPEPLIVAEATYRGDFLEEDVYEDWAVGPREQARAVYLAVARALVGLSVGSGDLAGASRYALRILERDPYDEPAHLSLVSARLAMRAHGEARRAYHNYRARMEEIGVAPAPFPLPDDGF